MTCAPPNPGRARKPARRVELGHPLHPLEALDLLEGLPGRVLLETVPPWQGRTLLAAAPQAVIRGHVGRAELRSTPWIRWPTDLTDQPAGGSLETLAAALGATTAPPASVGGASVPVTDLDPAGAWMGFLGYELAGEIERLSAREDPSSELPDLWFGAYDWVLTWPEGPDAPPTLVTGTLPGDPSGDRVAGRTDALMRLLSESGARDGERPTPDVSAETRADLLTAIRGEAHVRVGGGGDGAAPVRRSGGSEIDRSGPLEGWPNARISLARSRYLEAVERIQEYIRAGDLFQANLTCQLEAAFGDGIDLYRRLRERSPAPYGVYLEADGIPVVSISPEGFATLQGGRLRTCPIKGTRPRGESALQDRELAQALQNSEKDAAENVMIVDLLRNDLSQVSKPNSVLVSRLLSLESHPTVHHLVSEVEGELRENVGWSGILRALFPGGSITGAPKIRSMEILRDLEPVRRGAYTGSIGFIGFDGSATLSIAIRTAVVENGVARYGAGGGITLASDPEAEWNELLDKARAFLDVTETKL